MKNTNAIENTVIWDIIEIQNCIQSSTWNNDQVQIIDDYFAKVGQ